MIPAVFFIKIAFFLLVTLIPSREFRVIAERHVMALLAITPTMFVTVDTPDKGRGFFQAVFKYGRGIRRRYVLPPARKSYSGAATKGWPDNTSYDDMGKDTFAFDAQL